MFNLISPWLRTLPFRLADSPAFEAWLASARARRWLSVTAAEFEAAKAVGGGELVLTREGREVALVFPTRPTRPTRPAWFGQLPAYGLRANEHFNVWDVEGW